MIRESAIATNSLFRYYESKALSYFLRLFRFGILCLLTLHGSAANAIGDSGGCATFEDKLTKAATSDSAKNFLATLWAHVDSEEAHLNWLWQGLFAVSNSKRHQWREAAAKSILNGTPITGSDSCGNGMRTPLLRVSVEAGNYETTRAMLELGATPDAPRFDKFQRLFSTVFWDACDSQFDTRVTPPQVLEGRLQALKLILAKGADLNRATEIGTTALHVCGDPVILRFYLANGANPMLMSEGHTLLEMLVGGAIWHRSPMKESSLQSIEILLDAAPTALQAPTKRAIRTECARLDRTMGCEQLRRFFPDLIDKVPKYVPSYVEGSPNYRARHFDP